MTTAALVITALLIGIAIGAALAPTPAATPTEPPTKPPPPPAVPSRSQAAPVELTGPAPDADENDLLAAWMQILDGAEGPIDRGAAAAVAAKLTPDHQLRDMLNVALWWLGHTGRPTADQISAYAGRVRRNRLVQVEMLRAMLRAPDATGPDR